MIWMSACLLWRKNMMDLKYPTQSTTVYSSYMDLASIKIRKHVTSYGWIRCCNDNYSNGRLVSSSFKSFVWRLVKYFVCAGLLLLRQMKPLEVFGLRCDWVVLVCRARAIGYRQHNREAVGGFFSQIGNLYMVHHLWGTVKYQLHAKLQTVTMWIIMLNGSNDWVI